MHNPFSLHKICPCRAHYIATVLQCGNLVCYSDPFAGISSPCNHAASSYFPSRCQFYPLTPPPFLWPGSIPHILPNQVTSINSVLSLGCKLLP